MLKKLWSKTQPAGRCGLQFNEGEINLAYCIRTADQIHLKSCEVLASGEAWSERTLLLSERVKALGVAGVGCNVVLNQDQYQLFMMDAPKVPAEELRDAVKWKVKDLINYPLEQAVVDVIPLADDCGRAGQKLVYAVVAKKDLVLATIDAVQSAKLSLESIDIDEMSARNLASVASSGPRGAALVHLSAGKGSLSLVKNDCLYLSRNFSINYQAGLLDDLPSEALVLELQRSFDYYERQLGQVPPAHIWLFGENVSADKVTEILRGAFFGVTIDVLSITNLVAPTEQFDELILQQCASAVGASLRQEVIR